MKRTGAISVVDQNRHFVGIPEAVFRVFRPFLISFGLYFRFESPRRHNRLSTQPPNEVSSHVLSRRSVLWPAPPQPPRAAGTSRPGPWLGQCPVCASHAADRPWHWNTDQLVAVEAHADPDTQIDHQAWFEAFAQACHAAAR